MAGSVQGSPLARCGLCGASSRRRCPRCRRPLCDAHRPVDDEHCCEVCESEYRPLSAKNLAARSLVVVTGTALGAVGGLSLGLVIGTLLFLGEVGPARVVAMASAMLGTAIGFGAANLLGHAVVRARFLEQAGPRVPRARLVRGRRAALANGMGTRRLMGCARRVNLGSKPWRPPPPPSRLV